MKLKNPDVFRSWLIRQLEPICKANPEPVSKYVCALLKKERSDGELKNNLISQLYIFLHSATEEFVNFLIDALESEKYLNDDLDKPLETIKPVSETNEVVKDVYEMNEGETSIVAEEKKERRSPSPIQAPTPSPPKKLSSPKLKSPSRLKRNRFHNERRRAAGSGGARRGKRDSSPSNSPALNDRRTVNRKRSASGSSEESNKSPRRSWNTSRLSDSKKYRHRNLGRSPPAQRSRSPSPKSHKRRPNNGNFRKRARLEHLNDDRSGIGHPRKSNNSYQNDEIVDMQPAKALDLLIEGVIDHKQRCIDFESKGYCARGDMCPYDHGPAPIVLDNSLLNGIVPFPPPVHSGFPNPIYTPPFVNSGFPPVKSFRQENSPLVTNRELISVPTVPLQHKNKHVNAGKSSHGHVFSSLPPGVSQTSIELTNVPAEINNIPHLYEKFSFFGTLTLVQTNRNGDASTALLSYTNATEAALAFVNCANVVANVKAAWYADKCIMKPFPRKSLPSSNQNTNNKSFMFKKGIPAVPTVANVDKPLIQKVSLAQTTPTKTETTPVDKEKGEVRRQDPGKLLSDLIKKKRELLEKQLRSRKQIIDKIKSLQPENPEKKTWQDVLKKLNNVISDNKNSIKESLQQRKEYLQKMNIVPMDSVGVALNNLKENQGSLTKLQFPDLEAQAEVNQELIENGADVSSDPKPAQNEDSEVSKNENLSNPSSMMPSSQQNVRDDKTQGPAPEYSSIVVSGFENGDEGELIEHFSQFGKIVDKEIDNAIPSARIIYDNRKSAEDAKKDGRNFQDRLLSVTVHVSKKFVSTSRRSPMFKVQEYSTFNQYSSGNPYKYKNPQLVSQAAPRHLTASNRNVYSYRADQRNRTQTATSTETEQVVDNSTVKLIEEEDLITFLQKGGIDAKEVEKYVD